MRLQEIIKISADKNTKYEKTLENLRPPIFWKDKPIVSQQLKKWNLIDLQQIAAQINETEILMKKNSYLRNDIIVKNLIISLTNKACSTSF
jgi:DNA polymerase-3 subunit delta